MMNSLMDDKAVLASASLSWFGTAGTWTVGHADATFGVLAGIASIGVSVIAYRVSRARLRLLALQEREETIRLDAMERKHAAGVAALEPQPCVNSPTCGNFTEPPSKVPEPVP